MIENEPLQDLLMDERDRLDDAIDDRSEVLAQYEDLLDAALVEDPPKSEEDLAWWFAETMAGGAR